MKKFLKAVACDHKILKIMSFAIGYGLWSNCTQQLLRTEMRDVPVAFFNVPEKTTITCQTQTCAIRIKGSVADLRAHTDIALHIDGSQFDTGSHCITPDRSQLFLPKGITLLYCSPLTIAVASETKIDTHAS